MCLNLKCNKKNLNIKRGPKFLCCIEIIQMQWIIRYRKENVIIDVVLGMVKEIIIINNKAHGVAILHGIWIVTHKIRIMLMCLNDEKKKGIELACGGIETIYGI